jgi:CheY-like chemotaxis protein
VARILVVEDNDPVRWTLAALLRSNGYEVDQAANGQQALAQFADHPTDIILMDLHMPVMDGLEACHRLRQASQVPILMISTLNSPTIQKEILECGANAFIPKPLEFDLLLDWVRDVGKGSGGSMPPAGPSLQPTPGPAPRPPDPRPTEPTRRAGPVSLRGPVWQNRSRRAPLPILSLRYPPLPPGIVQHARKFDLSCPFEYTGAHGA